MEADVTYALLQSASIEGGDLSFCDKATRQNAIKVLLIARKVAQSIQRERQANPPSEALANLYRQYLESAYEQVDIQWRELYYTCGGELQSKLAAQAFVRRVQDEFRRSIY
jgi:hypothetical protein